jgi:hypothetical protein
LRGFFLGKLDVRLDEKFLKVKKNILKDLKIKKTAKKDNIQ